MLIITVLIAVLGLTSVNFAISSVKRVLLNTSSALLGGDRVIISGDPTEAKIVDLAKQYKFDMTTAISFYTMLSTDRNIALSGIKAVQENYPLRGQILIQSDTNDAKKTSIPRVGTIWLDSRAMLMLDVQVGDSVNLGSSKLIVTAQLTAAPDQLSEGFAFAPTGIMNQKDLDKSHVLGPGSRVTYKLLVSGSDSTLNIFDQQISQLLPVDYKYQSPQTKENMSNKALEQSEKYLSLAILINIFLAAVVISIAAKLFCDKNITDVAIMRCLGASAQQITTMYAKSLITLSVILGVIGTGLGFLLQQLVALVLKYAMHIDLPFPAWHPIGLGIGCSLVLVVGMGLPQVLRLGKITPLQVLRRDSSSQILINKFSTFTAFRFLGSLRNKLPALLRLTITNIVSNISYNITQVLAFALVIGVALLLFIIRGDLVATWKSKIPEQAPNYFAINMFPKDIDKIRHFLDQYRITANNFYPIVRGKLIKINQELVSSGDDEQGKRTGINRPLNLTWTNELPTDNKILIGAWFTHEDSNKNVISIENGIADRLGVKLGDELTFVINTQEITTKISSIRSVEWDSFNPNFYVIYPTGLLDKFPVTYMASFFVPNSSLPAMVDFVHAFPEVNLLSVTSMLEQAKQILDLVTIAISYIWLFTMLIGVLLLIAVVFASINLRTRQNNLLRILGARKRQLRMVLGVEFIILGSVAGLLGSVAALFVARYIAISVLQITYHLNWSFIGLGIIVGIFSMLSGGLLGTLKVFRSTPIQLSQNLN